VANKAAWEAKDNQIMSWILDSMESHLILPLRLWNYLKQVYKQDNNVRHFQLELAIANYTREDLSVQDYYSGFLILWNNYSDLVATTVSIEGLEAGLATIQPVHNQLKRLISNEIEA
jgi:hypothetical protein